MKKGDIYYLFFILSFFEKYPFKKSRKKSCRSARGCGILTIV
jgi:hypothetical protein|nr:MAG TPA: hypothetical protein [Caudoviricetes sp.]DAU82034.1 MAG TPA: hypothetical protein [Caudoviricetes sp.]